MSGSKAGVDKLRADELIVERCADRYDPGQTGTTHAHKQTQTD